MKKTSKNTSQYSTSHRSTRYSYDQDAGDSPFDEPSPLRIRCNPLAECRTGSLSIHQQSAEVENDSVAEGRLECASNALSEELDRRTLSIHNFNKVVDEDGSSGVCRAHDEFSDTSSFLSAIQFADKESVNEFRCRENEKNFSEHHVWDDFDAFCELLTSSFRSKPLLKPVIWKEYTCFKDTCSTSSATEMFPCGDGNCGSVSVWRIEKHSKPHHYPTRLDSTSAVEVLEEASHKHEYFRFESLQEYSEFVTISFHHFLKNRIFFEDPNWCDSKDDLDDIDSITRSLASSDFGDRQSDWSWKIAT